MSTATRRLAPELLDQLPADDPQARRSRCDLQRLHRAMATLSILRRAIGRLQVPARPLRILELGAGDATLLLRLARLLRGRWVDVDLTVLDRLDIVTTQTRESYRRLGWRVETLRADALAWSTEPASLRYDLCVTTLFLHHFNAVELRMLLRAIADRADAFVACEPRRNVLARLGSRLVFALGANAVTRADAVASVAAGFAGRELTALWPKTGRRWKTEEFSAKPFSHCFIAACTQIKGPEDARAD